MHGYFNKAMHKAGLLFFCILLVLVPVLGHVLRHNSPKRSLKRQRVEEHSPAEQCAICVEDLLPSDNSPHPEIMTLPCNHQFHKKCLGLQWAVNKKCPQCRREFLEIEIESPSKLLVDAVLAGDMDEIRNQLEQDIDPNTALHENSPVLFHAVSNNLIDVARLLIQHKADPNLESEYHGSLRSPLSLSMDLGNSDMFNMLLREKANPNTSEEETPLWKALSLRRIEMALSLLDHGANPDHRDYFERTALEICLSSRNPDFDPVIGKLFEEGVDVNALGSTGFCLLHFAVYFNNEQAVRLFAESEDIDIDCRDGDNHTPLSRSTNPKITRFLLDHGADPLVRISGFQTPLSLAVAKNDIQVLQVFFEKGRKYSYEEMNQPNTGLEPFLFDATSAQVFKLLVRNGADPSALDTTGTNCLHHALLKNRDAELIRIMAEFGVDLQEKDIFGETPLAIAEKLSGRETQANILKELLDYKKGENLLRAVETNDLDKVRKELDKGINPNLCRNSDGPLLTIAIRSNLPEMVSVLVDADARVTLKSTNGVLPIIDAIDMGNEEIVEILVNCGKRLTSNQPQALLIYALSKGKVNIALKLIETGIDLETKHPVTGNTPLQYCILSKNDEFLPVAEKLIEKTNDLESRTMYWQRSKRSLTIAPHKFSPLSFCILTGNLKVMELLLKADVKPVIEDSTAFLVHDPLFLAIDQDSLEAVQLLFEYGASANYEINGVTPLIKAVQKQSTCSIKIIRFLLEKGANVNAVTHSGNSALFNAVHLGNMMALEEIFKQEYEAIVDIENYEGNTPLCSANDLDTIRLLLNHGANPLHENHAETTCLHLSAQLSTTSKLKVFLEKLPSLDINVVDGLGNTLLHYAEHRSVADILLSKGINTRIRNNEGKTAVEMNPDILRFIDEFRAQSSLQG